MPEGTYPVGVPLDRVACTADHEATYRPTAPSTCAAKRTCFDDRQRVWVNAKPFFARGVYNGGYEYKRIIENCPAGAPCSARNPKTAADFVRLLADGGFNLIMDRTRTLAKEMADAIRAEDRVHLAHLLWSDPFTREGHDGLISEIAGASADPEVVMWFGPDEVDLNANMFDSVGIRRILRGSSPTLDGLLRTKYKPSKPDPFLPETEPAHDPLGLPFGAALAFDRGLAAGLDFYDVLLPITYPLGRPKDSVNVGDWRTGRVRDNADRGAPVFPILQMVGIPEMRLTQPTAAHVRALIAGSLVNGARGLFYYTLTGDKPPLAGRDGWFAPDDEEAWAMHRTMHGLVDGLVPVIYSATTETFGTGTALEWRTFETPGARRVVIVSNPTSKEVTFDVDAAIVRKQGERVRAFEDCAPIASRSVTVEAYGVRVYEVHR